MRDLTLVRAKKTLLARSGDDPLRPRCPPLPQSAHPSHQDAKLTRMITTSRPSAPKMPIPPLEHPRCPPLPPRCKADSVEVTCCLAHHGPDQLCIVGEGGRCSIMNLSVPDQLCIFGGSGGVDHQCHRQILRGAFFSHAPDPQRDRESLGAVAYSARECSKTDPPLSSLLGDPGIPGAGDLSYGGSLSVEPYSGRSWEVLRWATQEWGSNME